MKFKKKIIQNCSLQLSIEVSIKNNSAFNNFSPVQFPNTRNNEFTFLKTPKDKIEMILDNSFIPKGDVFSQVY